MHLYRVMFRYPLHQIRNAMLKLERSSLLALIAGFVFGAVSFAASQTSADCIDDQTVTESFVLQDASGRECSITAMSEDAVEVYCFSDQAMGVTRAFTKTGGEQ
mgnify:CR=1 FL=1